MNKILTLSLLSFLVGIITGRLSAILEISKFVDRAIVENSSKDYLEISSHGAKRLKMAIESLAWGYYSGLVVFLIFSTIIFITLGHVFDMRRTRLLPRK